MADKDYGLTTVVADPAVSDVDQGQHAHSSRATDRTEKEGLDRYINVAGIMNFAFTLQAGWEATGLMLGIALFNGGPAALVWGTVIGVFGHSAVALSLGEMASMDPTVGAQYRWSARFARKWPEFWGLMQGWITVTAWIFTVPATLVIIANTIQGLIIFHDATYVPQAWHVVLLMWAILVFAIVGNLYLRRMLNVFESIGGVCHVLFWVACIVVITTLGDRTNAKFVFTSITSGISGWKNPGLCFHLGLMATAGPLSMYDSVLHMIDETKEPRKRVPKSMVTSIIANGVMMFIYVICLLFCIGDFEKVSMSPLPILEIFYLATKSKTVATIIVLMHLFILVVATFNTVASACRLTWAFARDKGLPFDRSLTRINKKYQLPLNALALNSILTVIVSLINLGSTVAFQAILALGGTALGLSYALPIFLILIRKLKGEHPRYGPFKLGGWGLPINLFSLCFCIYLAFWTAFPIAYPVNTQTMNWAFPTLGAIVTLALIDWFTTGKTRFQVPVGQYNIEMEADMGSERDKKSESSA